MVRRQFLPISIALFVAPLLASFAPAPTPEVAPIATASTYRVSRHFAAGLEYLLVEPPDLPEDAELPMVVYVHGRGGVPTAPTASLFGVTTPIRVIVPRGPERFAEGYAWMPVSAHDGESEALVEAMRDRSAMLADALVEWRRRYPTRGKPLVVGFSQGGMLAANLALHHPESIAAAFAVAAWVPPSLMPEAFDPYAAHAPIHALHGAHDRVLSARRTRATFARLRTMGFDVTYEEIPDLGHAMNDRETDRLRRAIERQLEDLPQSSRASGNS